MKDKKYILIVDDDFEVGKSLQSLLNNSNQKVQTVDNAKKAIDIIQSNIIDVVLLDLKLPDRDGIDVLKQILEISPSIIVIMISGFGSIETAVKAVQIGAFDWLEKPLNRERVLLTVQHALEKRILIQEKQILLNKAKNQYKMIAASKALGKVLLLVDKVASSNASVLITGESGTGKELVARAIHLNSQRVLKPFVCLNCAAVPENLIESELFGHRKGSFTNATYNKEGKFQLAHTGTLFLDEIGDLSVSSQAKVLRSIETGEIEKVGAENTTKVNFRLISATNKHLPQMIKEGTFREDLYHRISTINIDIPPLRNRPEDILPLCEHYLKFFCKSQNIENKKISSSGEKILLQYSWPGNVRELRNVIEKMTVLIDSKEISGFQVTEILQDSIKNYNFEDPKDLKNARNNFERRFIYYSLVGNNWNITRTAKSLGIPRSTLYEKIEKFKLHEPSGIPNS